MLTNMICLNTVTTTTVIVLKDYDNHITVLITIPSNSMIGSYWVSSITTNNYYPILHWEMSLCIHWMNASEDF